MEPFLGPGPGTADCLMKAAADAGPHQGKLERAMTPSLQEIGMDYFQRVFLKYFREACVPLQIDNSIFLGITDVYLDKCYDSASCLLWPRGSLPVRPLSKKS